MHDRRESDIVLAAQNGSRQAFGELVERYQNLVTTIAFSKTGDLQRSEDIAQQSFLIAWEKLADLRDASRFAGWIRSITRNVVMNSNRKFKRLDRSARSIEPQQEPHSFDDPAETMTFKEQQELLWHSLKNIPEDYREPLILFYREDKSVAQVAEQMGLSVDAVKQRLSRGRAILKGEVEQFVEDLLGATKPSASFSAAVLALLPTVSASAVGQVAIKGGSIMGAKTMVGKLGLFASGSAAGILGGLLGGFLGVAGAWLGTKTAVENATSEEEKELLWELFRSVLISGILLVVAILFVVYWTPDSAPRGGWIIGLTCLELAAVLWLSFRFAGKQAELHRAHGRPEYLKDYDSNEISTPKQIMFSLLGSTAGCWIWLIVLASSEQQWLMVSLAIATLVCHMVFRCVVNRTSLKAPEVMRVHGRAMVSNGVLLALVIVVSSMCGSNLSLVKISPIAFAAIPFLASILIASMMWYGADRMEKNQLANPKPNPKP